MAKPYVIFGILILQFYVNAAPSDISKLGDIAQLEEAEVTLDGESATNDNSDTIQQKSRQKRFYNYYGYGFPPISPVVYPSYVKRDESFDTGVYGANDPFQQIHQRLQEIASAIRQPRPQPPAPLPIFFPVIYIPQNCVCNASKKDETTQGTPMTTEANQTNPNVTQRFDNDEDYETEFEDNNRPISFDPISVNITLARPPPPVEHGSSQAGAPDSQNTTTSDPIDNSISGSTRPPNDNVQAAQPVLQAPSFCDGAILSCCHQLQVTYDCFALQGCPDPTSYGNPCEVNVILSVIYKFQNYYAQRNG